MSNEATKVLEAVQTRISRYENELEALYKVETLLKQEIALSNGHPEQRKLRPAEPAPPATTGSRPRGIMVVGPSGKRIYRPPVTKMAFACLEGRRPTLARDLAKVITKEFGVRVEQKIVSQACSQNPAIVNSDPARKHYVYWVRKDAIS